MRSSYLLRQAERRRTNFTVLCFTQVTSENVLESLERAANGTVYEAVLHKTYRELMLLGFVAFIIFFLLQEPWITLQNV